MFSPLPMSVQRRALTATNASIVTPTQTPLSPSTALPVIADAAALRRVLLVKLSSLGDVVHALPLLDALRMGLGPDVHIAWAVRGAYADLLRGNPNLDQVYTLQKRGWGAAMQLGRETRQGHFDATLDAQGLFVSGALTRLSGAPLRIGLDRNREGNARFLTHAVVPGRQRAHIVDILMSFCDVLHIPRVPPRPQTYLSEGVGASQADALLATTGLSAAGGAPLAGFIVGASTPDKTWPVARWAEAAGRLHAAGVRVALLGGPSETATGAAVVAAAPTGSVAADLTGQTPLPTLAAVLARCGVVIGGDSGPMHLAVGVGTPVVGLYGVTDWARTGPGWGPAPAIILDEAIDDAPPERRRPRHATLPDALSRISARKVADAALTLLSRESDEN